ncbi:GDSL esterase/lipase At3g27950-like [Rhododendron vialii]|uniref:GDSL esterase/lipase At3g27950-like n=1 Tax=Rhododendron vialii TaxID=182163 RepID=UPI00265F7B21|nr:GDSL esterase/lipase At3g27950-like [Rhododendron vialii]
MRSRLAIWAFGVVLLLLVGGQNGGVFGSGNCGFPALFNFGDSNSDTGAASSAGGEKLLPFGVTIGKKSKRICDGRVIIDFLAEDLGLPYLNATVDSIGTSYKHGANFATGGCRIIPNNLYSSTLLPFNLDVQISQFLRFKSRSVALYKKLSNNSINPLLKSILPEPKVFSKALYTIDIGQNDIASASGYGPKPPAILDQFYNSVQRLLSNGAKFLWVHNTGPFGCLPWQRLAKCKQDGSPCAAADEHGCVKGDNNVAQQFNDELKDRVNKLRAKYPGSAITLVDVYSAKYSLFVNPNSQGFDEPFKYCCGAPGINCGARDLEIAGNYSQNYELAKLTGPVCKDPSKYIIWDGIHYTEAANRIVAKLIADGSHSDPPVPITQACHKR